MKYSPKPQKNRSKPQKNSFILKTHKIYKFRIASTYVTNEKKAEKTIKLVVEKWLLYNDSDKCLSTSINTVKKRYVY